MPRKKDAAATNSLVVAASFFLAGPICRAVRPAAPETGRDWGALMAYDLRPDSTGAKPSPAEIDTREITRSGWWHPSSMPTGEEDD